VFYKRNISPDTCSPVIPFYWGYRGTPKGGAPLRNGQHTDDYGNRLDKDLSKGGGPFANATNNLPDMWNRGVSALGGAADAVARTLPAGAGRPGPDVLRAGRPAPGGPGVDDPRLRQK
jgi:hypothetical protein